MHSDGQTAFAGALGSVYKSTNGGASWTGVLEVPNVRFTSLALSGDGQTVFAGTLAGDVYKSTDGGASWAEANSGISTGVFSLALSNNGQIVFAGTSGSGLYKSTDSGASWTHVNAPLVGFNSGFFNALALSSSDGQQLFAGTGEGVFKSTDAGASWVAVNYGLGHFEVAALAWSNAGHLFAGTGNGVYKSTNGGSTWTLANAGIGSQAVNSLAVGSNGLLFAGTDGSGVYKSVDGGTTWTPPSSSLPNLNVHSLALSSNGQNLLAGTTGSVYKSINSGNSWTAAGSGIGYLNVRTLALGSNEQNLFAGAPGRGVIRSTNGGTSWLYASSSLTNTNVRALLVSPIDQSVFAGTLGAGVFKSADSGATWAPYIGGLTNLDVTSLAQSNNGQSLFAGTKAGRVFKSTNGGAWTSVGSTVGNVDVLALVQSADGQNLYAGTDGGGVFKSTNGGAWTDVNAGLGSLQVFALAQSADGQNLFAGTFGGGVFKSTNGGPWTAINSGLGNLVVIALAQSNGGQTLFAGTFSGGVFKSTNGGATWAPANSGLSGLYVLGLAISSNGQNLFAGAFDKSVFKSTNGALSSESRLLNLALSANGTPVALSPAFQSDTLSYSATVQGASATLTPTEWISDEKITINNSPASSGTASSIPLSAGLNVIAVKVTSGDETSTRTYNVTITREVVAPAAPTNVQAALGAPGSGQATVSWTAPASSGSSALSGYTVAGNPSGGCTTGPGQTSCIVSGLTSGTTYSFTVAATNAEGASTGSVASNSVTPQSTQTINFPAQGSQAFTTGGSFAINPAAVATSGLTVTYGSQTPGVCALSGTQVFSIVSVGTCILTANQGGNAAWLPAAQATQNVVISKGTNTITFPAQGNQTYSVDGTFSLIPANASSGLTVAHTSLTPGVCSLTGSLVTMQGAGTCTIAGNQAGDSNWDAASQVTQSISIAKGINAITFGVQADRTFSLNGTFAPNPIATATSGRVVNYTSQTPTVCEVTASMIVMKSAGICTVAADEPGDANWSAATQVTQNVRVLATTPGVPTQVQATPTGPGQVTVTWTPPVDNGGGITGYVVTAQPGGQTCTPTPATATSCTFTGLTDGQTYTFTVEAINEAGSSAQGGPSTPSNPVTPLANPLSFSAPAPTGTGTVTANVTGGGSSCRFEYVRVMAVADAPTAPPAGLNLPHGLLDFALAGCDQTDVTFAISYPSAVPQGAQYWKLNGTSWAPYAGAAVQPGTSSVTLTLRDGGQGDDDGVVNGRIVDPGQMGVMASEVTASSPVPVPTLSGWALALLGLGLGWLGVGRRSLLKA